MKRRLVISESDRESILNLHEQEKVGVGQRVKSAVNAFRNPAQQPAQQPVAQTQTQQPVPQQPAPQQPAPQQPPVVERFTTAKCPGKDTKPGGKCDEKVLKLQVKINDKCPTDKLPVKLKEDGVMGTNTKNAMTACDSFIRATLVQTPTGSVTPNAPLAANTSTNQEGSTESIDSLNV